MKFQTPNPKLQKKLKYQIPKNRRADRGFRYVIITDHVPRLNDAPVSNGDHPFDLEERTAQFGERIVRFAKKIPRDPANDRLIGQIVGCGTSVGANYSEASERVSKKDFRKTIARCVKEAKETRYFLRIIAAAEPKLAGEARALYREAKELHLIFASIYRK
jgi:four helix bundle protein